MLKLDHVAIGLGDARPVIETLTASLGGTVIGGGTPPKSGFRAMQIHLGSPSAPGMTVELLEPWEPENNDFLVRFLSRHGDAPHHLTFKTSDVAGERRRLERLGFEPVGVDFSNPAWREMFLHPRQSHGTVIQIAQPGYETPPLPTLIEAARAGALPAWDEGVWWGSAGRERAGDAVRLRRVVLTSPAVAETVAFFVDVLAGTETPDGRVRWEGGEIVIEAGPAGIDRLECTGLAVPELRAGGTRFVAVPA